MIYFIISLSMLMIAVLSFLSGWCFGKKDFDFAKMYGVSAVPFVGLLIFTLKELLI